MGTQVFPDIWTYCDHLGSKHLKVIKYIVAAKRFQHYSKFLSSLLMAEPAVLPEQSSRAIDCPINTCPLCSQKESSKSLIVKHIIMKHYYTQLRNYLEVDYLKGKKCDCKVDLPSLSLYIRHYATSHAVLKIFCAKEVLPLLQQTRLREIKDEEPSFRQVDPQEGNQLIRRL